MRLSGLPYLLTLPLLTGCVPIAAVSTPTAAQETPAPLSAPGVETPAAADTITASPTPDSTPVATEQSDAQDSATSDVPTPKAALERLFTSETIEEEWFASAFLGQVSIVQIEEIVA